MLWHNSNFYSRFNKKISLASIKQRINARSLVEIWVQLGEYNLLVRVTDPHTLSPTAGERRWPIRGFNNTHSRTLPLGNSKNGSICSVVAEQRGGTQRSHHLVPTDSSDVGSKSIRCVESALRLVKRTDPCNHALIPSKMKERSNRKWCMLQYPELFSFQWRAPHPEHSSWMLLQLIIEQLTPWMFPPFDEFRKRWVYC